MDSATTASSKTQFKLSRRQFLRLAAGGAVLWPLAEGWRAYGPAEVERSARFPITNLMSGELVDASTSSEIFYENLRLHTLAGGDEHACADVPVSFLPDKTLVLKAAEGAALAAVVLLILERLTNPAPVQVLGGPLLDRLFWGGARAEKVREALKKALTYRDVRLENVGWAALAGLAFARAFGGSLNVWLDRLAAVIGGSPFHGVIASRNVFETLAYIVSPPFYVQAAEVGAASAVKPVRVAPAGPADAYLRTYEVNCQPQGSRIYVHTLQVAQPERGRVKYLHASGMPGAAGRQTLSANLDTLLEASGVHERLMMVGHHYAPEVDWVERGEKAGPWAGPLSEVASLAVHTTPDGLGVTNADGRLLGFTPLIWAGGVGSNFGQRVEAHRRLRPSEYNGLCLKGAQWVPALTLGWDTATLARDVVEQPQLWKDLLCEPIIEEFAAHDPATSRLLMIDGDRLEVVDGPAGYDHLMQLAGRALRDETAGQALRELTLIRPGSIVENSEVPQGRANINNPNGKSAINWVVVKGGQIQGFVIGLQTARFEYALELTLVRQMLRSSGMEYDYLIDCDEHTAGQLKVPWSADWVRPM